MKKIIIGLVVVLGLVGCVTNENQLSEALKKNPKILFDVIEDNPEQFIEVVSRAAHKAQQQQYEKKVAELKAAQEKELKEPKKPRLLDERRLIGNANAKIIVVEYADFQCPACRMAFDSLKRFKEKYKGQVQFYYKHMPLDFHKMAYPAAQYFEAIRLQDKQKAVRFFEFVYENQTQLLDEEFLKNTAIKIKVDMTKLQQDLNSDKVKQFIQDDIAEFHNFGFAGTPVILINGVTLHGAQKIEELERIAKLTGGQQ